MVSSKAAVLGFSGICFFLLPAGSFAEEAAPQEAVEAAQEAVEAAPAVEVPSAPVEAAPAGTPKPPAVTPPELKPITITFAGTLDAVKTAMTPPSIWVQDRYGVKKEISVPQAVEITDGTSSKQLSDLKSGGKLTVEYSYDVATGKRTAQSILIGTEAK